MKKGERWFALLLVFVILLTSVGQVPAKAQAAKLRTVTVSTQKQLEAAMKDEKVGKVIISTKSKVTLTIPKSTGSSKKSLVVKAANATLVNNGSFQTITIEASKKFTENAKGNTIVIKEKGAKVNIVANGKVEVNILAKADISLSGKAKTTIVIVDKKAEGTVLKASTAIKLDTKATIDVTLKAGAEGSTLKSSDKNAEVAVKNETNKEIKLVTMEGTISIGKGEETKKPGTTVKPTATPTPTTAPSGGNSGNNSGTPSDPSTGRIPVNSEGFDAKGRMVAYFGSPSIDGTVDKVWEEAVPVTLKDTAGKTDTTAEFRVMWDDSALYILAKVKDSALDSAAGNVYEKDSIEIFLDEKNNKTKDYGQDDLHFRVNYKNEQSADNGDLSRLYTEAKTVSDGYVIEARIALADKLAKNGTVYGFELSLNDAKGGKRITALNVFDKTGMAYANTGLFGNLLLAGKKSGAVSGLNPYDLLNLVASSKKIMLERYINGDAVKDLIAQSEAAIKSSDTTQKKIDDLYAALDKAVENLISDGKSYDEKECRQVPLKYKTVDDHKGTIERVTYNMVSYDGKNEARTKDFLVYLPNGYNAADKSKKYNVLYLIHGMGEDQNTVFGGPGQNTEMMKILDNMIYNKKLEPMIIVTPTWSYNGNSGDFSVIGSLSEIFHNELVKDIIPKVEGMYNTYAASTSEKDLIAARAHRAVAGFSMGSATTWNILANRIDYFKYYMPISAGYSKNTGTENFTGTIEERRAQYLESVVKDAGYGPNDVSIFSATGTADSARAGLLAQIEAMKKVGDTFIYSADLNKGNFYFLYGEGGTHSWNSVNKYLYNMLPDLFNNKKIAITDPAPITVDENGFDESGRIVANFGTPSIDGTIDQVWSKAAQFSAKPSATSPASAKFRMLWDEKALYILAEVKDSNLDLSSGNVYDRDSMELFFDENHDRTVNYNKDDLHFRVSYDNKQSADNGDLGRFYTKTSVVEGGYIVEARLALTGKPANSTVYGIDLSVNDGAAGRKIGQLGVFDQNNEAYKDTSKFGAIILSGRARGAVSGLNPYDLMNVVEEGKEIKLERYTNGTAVVNLIAQAENVLKNNEVTQKVINDLCAKLRAAIDGLIPDGNSYADKECRRIPQSYKLVDDHQGTIERINYDTVTFDGKNVTKDFLVYLPNGYNKKDKTKKYNILYLIHGMGENQNTVFGGPGENTEMMKILDNMIYNKQIEPLIVVTPTWSYNGNSGDFSVIFQQTEYFHNELVNNIIPKVEGMYNTYAASTSPEALKAVREHRALAGFSMGSSTTWNTFASQVDYFKYYMPMSLSFIKGVNVDLYEGSADERKAEYLANVMRKAGYGPNDVSIFCATGTEDMAYGGMVSQIEAMKKVDDKFIYTADLNKGNFYFMTLTGGTHTWNCVNRYLYNMLPDLFNTKKIDTATIPVGTYVDFDKNDGTGVIGTRKANADGYVKLPTNEIKLPGAELAGWSTAADSTTPVVPESDGTYKAANNTTLYAVWKWSKPSVVSTVSGGAIAVDTTAPQNIKLGVVVSGSAITVEPSSGVIVANAGADFTLDFTKSVSNVTANYVIQYAAVDVTVSDLSSVIWKDVSAETITVDSASTDRNIYVRISSGEGSKIHTSDPVLLEIKNESKIISE